METDFPCPSLGIPTARTSFSLLPMTWAPPTSVVTAEVAFRQILPLGQRGIAIHARLFELAGLLARALCHDYRAMAVPLTCCGRGATRRTQHTALGLPPEHPTLPSLLRKGGYSTALVGKWHLGSAPTFGPSSGYEEFFGPMGGGVDYFSHVGFSGARDLWEGDRESAEHGYLTDLITGRAVEYVQRKRDRPFFLSVHYTAPHWPWETRDDAEELQRIGAKIAHLDGGSVQTYLKMISHMDEGIGQIFAAIPEAQRDNTLVVLSATMAANGSRTIGRLSVERWICLKAEFVSRKSLGGRSGLRRARMQRCPR